MDPLNPLTHKCVPYAQCGCSFEGRYYQSGQTVILDEDCGRRCSCTAGSMTCSPHGCGPHESCSVDAGERGCRPNGYATCWIRGPGSYQTFDALTYQYPGACKLIVAQVIGSSDHPHFNVSTEKVPQVHHMVHLHHWTCVWTSSVDLKILNQYGVRFYEIMS
uniref:VWFD domain-containing protein n=1 Tax=Oryzias latipes TaxID=8090 RepID=A0A3P9L5L0_ORYLA